MSFIVNNSRAIRLSVVIVALISILSVLAYVYEAERRFESVSDVLSQRLITTTQTVEYLSRLSAEIGYGGFIHNFKNYVLRRDVNYKYKAEENYKQILLLIRQLEQMIEDKKDHVFLREIRRTIEEYNGHLDELTVDFSQPQIAADDKMVKVDDTAAINAIHQLYNMVDELSQQTIAEANLKQKNAHIFIKYGFGLVILIALVALFLVSLIKKLEIKTLQANRANEAKGRYLLTMSEEIRTPLNGILGLIQLFNMKKLSKEERRHLNLIQSSGQVLINLLNDILDMNKAETRELHLDVLPFDANLVLGSTTNFYKKVAAEKNLIMNYHSSLPQNLYLHGDSTKLRQILSNLLAHVVKNTDVGSVKISVDGECENNFAEGEMCLLEIHIIDTGLGLKSEEQAEFLEQASGLQERSTHKLESGQTLVKELCDLMDATIEVESLYGEGTNIKILIPMMVHSIEQKQSEESEDQAYMDAFKDVNVLVAEENMVNAVVTKGFLEHLGSRVRVAHDGAEVIRLFDHMEPDIIVMDINMPVKDGIQTSIEIRQRPNGKKVPIIALTGDAFEQTHEKCKDAGMTETLTKPFSFELLRNSIYGALSSRA